MMKDEIVMFETEDKSITLPVSVRNDTVWLSANQMAELFERDEKQFENTLIMYFRREKLIERTTRKKCVLME